MAFTLINSTMILSHVKITKQGNNNVFYDLDETSVADLDNIT
jgi:hypothetical protein